MPAGPWMVYDHVRENFDTVELPLSKCVLKCALFTGGSNAHDLSLKKFSQLTNQLAGKNGYERGGLHLNAVWNTTPDGLKTLDSDNPVWTADGGSLVARSAVIYADWIGTPHNWPICVSKLDEKGEDIEVPDQGTMAVVMNEKGIFSVRLIEREI